MKNPVAIGFSGENILLPYVIFLVFIGIYLTLRLKFPQFRFLFLGLKIFSGNMDEKGLKGQLVHSRAFFTGAASSLFIGGIIGTSLAVMTGGYGSLLWSWLLLFLLMPARLASTTLAIKFRTKLPSGRYLSGPMYFIEKALKARWLAVFFASISLFTVILLGIVAPVATLQFVSENAFGIKGMTSGFLIMIVVVFIILGGIRRIGKVAGYLVPLGLFLFVFSFYIYPSGVLKNLFSYLDFLAESATSLSSGVLGACGILLLTMETGVGKSAGISGVVKTDYSAKHGLVAMLSGAAGILVSFFVSYVLYSFQVASMEEQKNLLSYLFTMSGTIPGFLLFASLFLLAIPAIAAWFYTGEQSSFYILGEKFANLYKIFFFAVILFLAAFYSGYKHDIMLYSYSLGLTFALFTAIPVLVAQVLLFRAVRTDLSRYITSKGVRYEVFKDIYLLFLTLLPKNLISKIFGLFSGLRLPRFMMVPMLKAFAKMYKINLDEAELEIIKYNSLNQFFTRALKAGARIIDSRENAVVSPCDSRITSFGEIHSNTLIQAKGINYSLSELLGTERYLEDFKDGKFMTFYLSPTDYHRIHAPFAGRVLGYYYEPGKLFPVNELAVAGVRALFPKNERLITFLGTKYGKIAVIKVGASNVGRIRVTYEDKMVTNAWIRFRREKFYDDREIFMQKGEELGRFEMGSTVILVFEKNTFDFTEVDLENKVQYGTTVGFFRKRKK